PAQPGLALMWLGFDIAQWNGEPLPLDLGGQGLPGCRVWGAPHPGALVVAAHGGSTPACPLAIPADPSPRGPVFRAPAVAVAGAAPWGLGAATNAVLLRVY